MNSDADTDLGVRNGWMHVDAGAPHDTSDTHTHRTMSGTSVSELFMLLLVDPIALYYYSPSPSLNVCPQKKLG